MGWLDKFSDLGGFFSKEGGVAKSKSEQLAKKYAREAAKPKPHIVREHELEALTTPRWDKFFPAESQGKKGKVLTFFDTEVDDRGRILTIAAKKVRFNYSKLRFENIANDVGFFRVYNPADVDKNVSITKQSHGLSGKLLSGFRNANKVQYSSNWDLSQYEAFQQYIGNSEVAGHNIVRADIPWAMRPTGRDFNVDTYKKGFFDTLHYAKAIMGKESAALQSLASKFHLTLGLQAHEAASDVVTNVKVLEALIKTNINSSYTAEALYALGLPGVQTHYKQNLALEEGRGSIIEGARGKPLHNLPYVGAAAALKGWSATRGFDFSNAEVLDIKDSFDIPQDVYDNARSVSGYLGENYGEETLTPTDEAIMADYGELKTLVDRFRVLDEMRPAEPAGSFDKDGQRIIKWLRTVVSKRGSHAGETLIDTSKYEDALRTQLRDLGYGDNPSADLMQRFARRAEQENAFAYWQKQVAYNTTAGNLIAKDRKQFEGKGLDWFDKFAGMSEADMSPAAIEEYKASKKEYIVAQRAAKKLEKAEAKRQLERSDWDIKAKAAQLNAQEDTDYGSIRSQLAEEWAQREKQKYDSLYSLNEFRTLKADEEQRVKEESFSSGLQSRLANEQHGQEAYAKGLVFKGDLNKLDAVTLSTEEYNGALDKLISRNKKLVSLTDKLAHVTEYYNPMKLVETVDSQRTGIVGAAKGILPSFLEKPVFRGEEALHNVFNQFKADIGYKWDMAQIGLKTAGTLGGAAAGSLLGPVGAAVGANVGGFLGTVGSQALGGYAQKKITEYGEGVQHRLNLLGMATTALSGFISGLRTAIGLFGKLGQIWSYMPSYTLHTLTGVNWNKAQPMAASDRLVGLKEGSISNIYNQLAYQQADLYTSGMYDETKLVAAARLGIFDLAYGAMGGDVEQQQADIYDRLYKQLYKSGLSKADQQSMLSLVKNYDPNLVAMLERGHGLAEAGYTEYEKMSGFTSSYGRSFLSKGENARVSRDSAHWDLDQRSFKEAIALGGARAYELGEPLIKAVENSLWKFVRGGDLDLDRVWGELEKLWGKIKLPEIDFGKIDWKKKLDKLDPLFNAITEKLSKVLTSFYDSMSATKIKFDVTGLVKAFFSGKPFEIGDYLEVNSPRTLAKKALEKTEKAFEKNEEIVNAKAYSWEGVTPFTLEFADTNNPIYKKSPLEGVISDRSWNSVASKFMREHKADKEWAWQSLANVHTYLGNAAEVIKDAAMAGTPAAYSAVVEQLPEDKREQLMPLIEELLQPFLDARTGNVKTVLDTGEQSIREILLNLRDALKALEAGNKVSLRIEDVTQMGVNAKLENTLKQVG